MARAPDERHSDDELYDTESADRSALSYTISMIAIWAIAAVYSRNPAVLVVVAVLGAAGYYVIRRRARKARKNDASP